VIRHAISIVVAWLLHYYLSISLNLWFKNTFPLWLLTIILLLAVLVVGTEVNGSTRWIRVAVYLAATEVAKVMMAIFTADYVVRRAEEVRNNTKAYSSRYVMLLTVGLIIAEPDLGATVVIAFDDAGCVLLGRRAADSVWYGFWCNSFSLCFPDCI
jgi:cell division protein FtsW